MIETDDINVYLTTEDLAVRYDLKPNTIQHWRRNGKGPKFYKRSPIALAPRQPQIRYKLADVLAWEQTNNITPIN
jgi:hypothetical protein